MIKKRELIENLTVVREWTMEDEGIPALVESIKARGQRNPILTFESYVVDGAKRIAALKILGREAVEINVTDDLIEMIETIGGWYKKGPPPTPDRLVDYLMVIEPLMRRRGHRAGGVQRWHELHPELVDSHHQWGRQMLDYAFGGVFTVSGMTRLSQLISQALGGSKVAQEQLDRVRTGEITPHQAGARVMREGPKLLGPTKTPAEQLRVLTNGTANLVAAVEAFKTLGAPLRVDEATILGHVAQLKRAHSNLYALIKEITKESRKGTE